MGDKGSVCCWAEGCIEVEGRAWGNTPGSQVTGAIVSEVVTLQTMCKVVWRNSKGTSAKAARAAPNHKRHQSDLHLAVTLFKLQ